MSKPNYEEMGFRKRNLLKPFLSGAVMALRPFWQRASYGGKDMYTALKGDWVVIGRDINRVIGRENEKRQSEGRVSGNQKGGKK